MATIETQLARAEFWDAQVCLACGEVCEEREDDSCPECGHVPLVDATHVRAFLARVRAQEDEGGGS